MGYIQTGSALVRSRFYRSGAAIISAEAGKYRMSARFGFVIFKY